MRLSCQTITNWLEKGSRFFKGVMEYLKDNCLEKDAVVNCDETWCRVKVGGKYRKKYVWCLVNRLARVAVYYYEDGSRGRKVLKDMQTVRLYSYEKHSCSLYEKRFEKGYKFMKVSHDGDKAVFTISWDDVVVLFGSPVVKTLKIK